MTSAPPPNHPSLPGQIPPPPPPGSVPQAGPQGAPFGPPGSPVPPPPPGTVPVAKAPPVAWLIPLAALLSVIGSFTPWFTPEATLRGRTISSNASLYSLRDGKVGLVAPIALVVLAVTALGLLLGRVRGRLGGSPDPVRSLGKYAVGAGAVSVVCLVIAWFFVPSQFNFGGLSWSAEEARLKEFGGSLSRGPQFGYWLTLVAALLAVIAGVVLLVQAKSTAPAATQAPPPPGAYPPAQPLSLDKQPPPST